MRRCGGSEQPVKGRHANRAREVSIAAPSIADLQDQVGTLARELKEAREQQTATAEVLRVISHSPTDTELAFEAIAESAARVCAAEFCIVYRFDGELMHFMACHGVSTAGRVALQRVYPMRPGRGSCAARAILSGTVEQIPGIRPTATAGGRLVNFGEQVRSRLYGRLYRHTGQPA